MHQVCIQMYTQKLLKHVVITGRPYLQAAHDSEGLLWQEPFFEGRKVVLGVPKPKGPSTTIPDIETLNTLYLGTWDLQGRTGSTPCRLSGGSLGGQAPGTLSSCSDPAIMQGHASKK